MAPPAPSAIAKRVSTVMPIAPSEYQKSFYQRLGEKELKGLDVLAKKMAGVWKRRAGVRRSWSRRVELAQRHWKESPNNEARTYFSKSACCTLALVGMHVIVCRGAKPSNLSFSRAHG